MKKLLLPILPISFLIQMAMAQDIHTSHLHSSPLTINPALTGVVEGTARAIVNYRRQWQAVTADYRTALLSIDADLIDLDRNSSLGVGFQVINDVAGDLNFSSTSYLASFSMIRSLNNKQGHTISVGMQTGWVNSHFDPNNIVAFDEEVNLISPQTNYFDVSLGVLWMRKIQEDQFVYGGLSLYHINSPIFSFFDEEDPENQLYRRFVAHGGANFNINDRLKLLPNAIYMKQGPFQQMTLGSFLSYSPKTDERHTAMRAFMPGIWVRTLKLEEQFSIDAIVIAARFNWDRFNLTFSYDANISSLNRASNGRGGPEISLIYQIGELQNDGRITPFQLPWKKEKKFDCYDFF